MGVFCVANASDDTISVLNRDTYEIVDTIILPSGCGPRRLCSFDGKLFCANSYSDTVAVIHEKNIKMIPVGKYPTGIDCSNEYIYIACGDSNDIWALDQRGKQHFCAPAGGFPNSLKRCKNGLVCASMLSNEVRVYDDYLQLIHHIEVEEHPVYALYSALHDMIYVCHFGDRGKPGSVCVYTSNGKMIKKYFAERMATTIALTSDETTAYICCTENDGIWVLDCASLEIIERRNVGRMPDDIWIDKKTGHQLVTFMSDGCLKVFDKQGKILSEVHTGSEPRGICYWDNFSTKKR